VSGTTADTISATRELALAELEELQRDRRGLSLDVISGDITATARLEGIDLQIGALQARVGLCDLAEQEHAEREQAAAREAAEREQARLERDRDRLQGERDAALRGLQRQAIATGRAAAETCRLDDELQAVHAQLGQSTRGISGVVGDLIYVHVKDESGIEIEKVMAGSRAVLLADYPLPDESASVEPAPDPGTSASLAPPARSARTRSARSSRPSSKRAAPSATSPFASECRRVRFSGTGSTDREGLAQGCDHP
jgi:hypothetical protein